MPNDNDVRVRVEQYEDGQWKLRAQTLVSPEVVLVNPTLPVPEPEPIPEPPPSPTLPKGLVYPKNGKLYKDGKPHSLQIYFNYKRYPDVLVPGHVDDAIGQLDEYANFNYLDKYIDETLDLGFNAITILMGCQWFQPGVMSYKRLGTNSPFPNTESFDMLETIIRHCVKRNVTLHIWAWGDEDRHWTPVGLKGGINGEVDDRLQMEIARRLGSIGGWTMGYGFDLREWVKRWWRSPEGLVVEWADNINSASEYEHALCARGINHDKMNWHSVAGEESNKPITPQPIIYEERFFHGRWGRWNTQYTKNWRDQAVANGISAMYGIFYGAAVDEYPDKQILRG